jgi:hypothetical protein
MTVNLENVVQLADFCLGLPQIPEKLYFQTSCQTFCFLRKAGERICQTASPGFPLYSHPAGHLQVALRYAPPPVANPSAAFFSLFLSKEMEKQVRRVAAFVL